MWPAPSDRSASASSRGAGLGVDEAEACFREQAEALARRRRRPVHPRDVPRRERDRRGHRRRPRGLRSADRRADDDRGGRQQPRRHAAGAVRAGARPRRRRRHRRQLQRRPRADARDHRADGAARPIAALSAQPNAGRPRDIEGRNIYLSSPEYMASYARRFVQRGVRLVGGCCGTTPEHIRQIRLAVQALAPSPPRAGRRRAGRPPATPLRSSRVDAPPVPRAEKSALGRALQEGRGSRDRRAGAAQGARRGGRARRCAALRRARRRRWSPSATGCAAARG